MLANHMLRDGPSAEAVTTIAEDVSGQTGACRPCGTAAWDLT